MNSFKTMNNIVGWLMFAVAATVYMLTAEPTGSLWDCGEFISAAYKLEVVHPPGAPLFLLIGRVFAWVAETFSADKANIAYALNVMSGLCTAALVMFVFWSTTILAKLALLGHSKKVTDSGDMWAILGSGIVAALATTFTTSVWFSAVEGEVYAMSTGFTGLVIWAALRWYVTDTPKADRWLVFIAYMIGLSIGVHLLSLLAIPFMALLYYYKKQRVREMTMSQVSIMVVLGFALLVGMQFMAFLPVWLHLALGFAIPGLYVYAYLGNTMEERKAWFNIGLYFVIGFAILMFVQAIFIPKLPAIAAGFDFTFVNDFGMSVGSGFMFFVVLLVLAVIGGLYFVQQRQWYGAQMGLMMFAMALMGFSTYALILIRANANTPINMNDPRDPYSLLSYLNREQYGERPLAYGPHFAAEQVGYISKGKSYRPVKGANGKVSYQAVGEKGEYRYRDSDMMLFPRLGHMDENRASQYRRWLDMGPEDKPTMSENLEFFFRYQIGWMYFRYFMWNFAGRQNAQQGYYATDPTRGNWISGIGFIDSQRLVPQSNLPESMRDQGRNAYYFLPLLFGLIGLMFHVSRRPQDALALGVLFLMTGVAIILFSNQPPSEPRERDYVLVGSMFTFCMWIGLSVVGLYAGLKDMLRAGMVRAMASTLLVITAPLIMGFQNWDDHSRANHTGARDYATNFLQSCAPNAIIFTYGDNDTYPLWYAQEVEGIRTDVRVVNFSLLAVDWYIDQLRRKMNNSDAIPMTISKDAYRGTARNVLQVQDSKRPMTLIDVVKFMGGSNPTNNGVSYVPTSDAYIAIDKAAIRQNEVVPASVPDSMILDQMPVKINGRMIFKDDIALYDIVATNAANGWKRPIYFAVTVRPEKIGPFSNFLQLEGMAQRIVPIFTQGQGYAGAMSLGRTEVDTMYRNMMERFRWGNFDKQKMFVDESYSPSIQTLQFAFMRVVNELKMRGDKDRALKALEKMYASFPHYNFPIDEGYSRLQGLGLFLELGAEDKAKPHLKELLQVTTQKMAYFSQFVAPNTLVAFEGSIRKISEEMERKRQIINQAIQSAGGAQMDPNTYAAVMKMQQEYQQLEAQKNQITGACKDPEMAAVFESEISMVISVARMGQQVVSRMQDEAFRKEFENAIKPYGFTATPSMEPKIEKPLDGPADTAKKDTNK